jgi:hypothetical protein
MSGFMPDIHVFRISAKKDVDGEATPFFERLLRHHGTECFRLKRSPLSQPAACYPASTL